jgi:hypothetical protein
MNTMTHKGYEAIVEYDDDADLFHGEAMNTRDVITFQGRSVDELKTAFASSVEDYLAFCRERGEEPEKAVFWTIRCARGSGPSSHAGGRGQACRHKPQQMDRRDVEARRCALKGGAPLFPVHGPTCAAVQTTNGTSAGTRSA